ncbi:MAG: radical SAM protein [Candidatus Zixiibacteriota bacterium]
MSVEIITCPPGHILQPGSLPDYKYEIGPYFGCEHNCRYCYGHDNPDINWSGEIQIHHDFTARLQGELASIDKQTIIIGQDSDPYQPIEKTLQHTRQALELLCINGFSACILTKSDLVIRDIDLLLAMPGSSVGFSFAFQTERSRIIFEDKAPSNRQRIEALKKLNEAGVKTFALISPVMPLITNIELQLSMLEKVVQSIWIYRLKISSPKAQSWLNIEEIINNHCPEIYLSFKKIAFAEKHQYWDNLTTRLEHIKAARNLNLITHI